MPQSLDLLLAGDPATLDKAISISRGSGTASIVPYLSDIYSLGEHIEGRRMLSSTDFDVVHFPHYNAPWSLPSNSVVTVHDLIHFLFPQFFGLTKSLMARLVLLNAIKKASRVIAVSQATKNDLVRMFPQVLDLSVKTSVVYQGVSSDFSPQPTNQVARFIQKLGLRRYILYVGSRKPHKNLRTLLEAFDLIQGEFSELQLVICGQRFKGGDDVDQYRRRIDPGRLIELTLADSELPVLYAGAQALVMPSLYEGFGLPALEAMACGTPIVVADVASLPEVVGEAALLFQPKDVGQLVGALSAVLSDENLRTRLRTTGLNRASQFSWEKTARQTVNVYEEVYALHAGKKLR